MDKIKNHLTEHPYFKKHFERNKNDIYVFEYDEKIYEITISKKFEPGDTCPVTYNCKNTKKRFIQEQPVWFKKIFEEAMDLYYHKHRIRYLMNSGKRPYDDVIFIHSLHVENGYNFYRGLINTEKNTITTEKKWKNVFFNLMERLKKEGYEVGTPEENGEYISFHIN